jgi:hypothetical protein
LPQARGGLGLLDVATQAQVLGAQIMLRSIQPRDHPLQAWMQSQFYELSLQLYGIKNFGCLFANWARVQTEFSAVMTSSYATWLEMYHCLEFAPLSPSQFLEVDIWGDP